MKKAIDADPLIKLIFICSPGNPTGTLIPVKDVQAVDSHGSATRLRDDEVSRCAGRLGARYNCKRAALLGAQVAVKGTTRVCSENVGKLGTPTKYYYQKFERLCKRAD